jgi:LPS-assembly lipoprotein
MSLSDRRTVLRGLACLALPALALPGCGFTPAHGPAGPANRLQNAVLPDAPQGRDQFLLIQQFEDRLGRGTDGPYALAYTYTVTGARMGVTADNVTTRFNLVGSVTFALRDRATDAVLIRGTVDGFTGFSTTGSTSATEAASRDARTRLAVLLADKMVTQLIATAANLPA